MGTAREQIIRTGLKLFLKKSFKEVTLKELLAETGLSKGAFYHHFASKEAVFLEVVDIYMLKVQDDLYTNIQADNLRDFFATYVRLVKAKMEDLEAMFPGEESVLINYFQLAFGAQRLLPHFKEMVEQKFKEELVIWEQAFRRAQANGEVASHLDPVLFAEILVAVIDGAGIRQVLREDLGGMQEELMKKFDGLYALLRSK